MSQTKKLLIYFLCAIGALFLIAGYSIISVFIVNFNADSDTIVPVIYLFLHLIVLAFAFYYVFRAYVSKPVLMSVFMIDEYGNVIKKSKKVAMVLFILGLLLVGFNLAMLFGLNKIITIFSLGLQYAVLNTALTVGTGSIFFYIYPKVHLK